MKKSCGDGIRLVWRAVEIKETVKAGARDHGRVQLNPFIEKQVRSSRPIERSVEVEATRLKRPHAFVSLLMDGLAANVMRDEKSQRRAQVTQSRASFPAQMYREKHLVNPLAHGGAQRFVAKCHRIKPDRAFRPRNAPLACCPARGGYELIQYP
jgi:hypothetical protein